MKDDDGFSWITATPDERRDAAEAILLSYETCGLPTRQWGGSKAPCLLSPNHRGDHSIIVFTCDGCGKVRRGRPHYSDENVGLCFLCTRLTKEYYGE